MLLIEGLTPSNLVRLTNEQQARIFRGVRKKCPKGEKPEETDSGAVGLRVRSDLFSNKQN